MPSSRGLQETIAVNSGTTINDWLANIQSNLVQTPGKLEFKPKNTDSDSKLVFIPHYSRYQDRYGIYWIMSGAAGGSATTNVVCPDLGTGGTGGSGGAGGATGGTAGSGGGAGTGGRSGSGGGSGGAAGSSASGSGGASSSSSGGSPGSSGGAPAGSGGSASGSGGSSSTGVDGATATGCSCDLGRSASGPAALGWLLAFGLLLGSRARHRRTR